MIETQDASILFVDDERDILDILQRTFESSFKNIFIADNAISAMKIVRGNVLDVAVLDLKMPDKSGLELCQEMKVIAPDLRFIFLTGFADRENIQAALRLGVDNFIDKPFDANYLKLSVMNTVEKAQYTRLVNDIMELFIQKNTSLDFSKFAALSIPEKKKIVRAALGVAKLQIANAKK